MDCVSVFISLQAEPNPDKKLDLLTDLAPDPEIKKVELGLYNKVCILYKNQYLSIILFYILAEFSMTVPLEMHMSELQSLLSSI